VPFIELCTACTCGIYVCIVFRSSENEQMSAASDYFLSIAALDTLQCDGQDSTKSLPSAYLSRCKVIGERPPYKKMFDRP